MKLLKVNPNSYEKIKEFQDLLRKKGINIIAKSLPSLVLEVNDIDLDEVFRIAEINKIYFDEE